MQVKNNGNMEERSILYLSKGIASQLKRGENYKDIIPTIVICITNFNFLERNSYHSVAKMKFDKTIKKTYIEQGYKEEQEELTDLVEMHFIELPKFVKKNPGVNEKIEQWLWLISGEGAKIEMAKKKNSRVREAMELVDKIMQNPKERELYEALEKARMDYSAGMEYSKEEGMKQGIEQGMERGREKEKIEIAKAMLKKKIEIDTISEITGLSKEEINDIRQ